MINLDALLSAIQARKALAEAAGGEDWAYDGNPSAAVTTADGRSAFGAAYNYPDPKCAAIAAHVAANSPAATLRQVERDLRVLERHQPFSGAGTVRQRVDYCTGCNHDCCSEPWPCIEIRELAHAYAIPTEDGT